MRCSPGSLRLSLIFLSRFLIRPALRLVYDSLKARAEYSVMLGLFTLACGTTRVGSGARSAGFISDNCANRSRTLGSTFLEQVEQEGLAV